MEQEYFTVSLCALMDSTGKTLYRDHSFAHAHIPELLAHLSSTMRRRIVLMGKSTFQALTGSEEIQKVLFPKDRLVLVVTKSAEDIILSKNMTVIPIDDLSYLAQIWKILEITEMSHAKESGALSITISNIADKKTEHYPIIGPLTECEIIVIGGKTLYRDMLPYAEYIHQYLVYGEYPGETTFPAIHESKWRSSEPKTYHRDDETKTPLFIYTLKKRVQGPFKKLRATPPLPEKEGRAVQMQKKPASKKSRLRKAK